MSEHFGGFRRCRSVQGLTPLRRLRGYPSSTGRDAWYASFSVPAGKSNIGHRPFAGIFRQAAFIFYAFANFKGGQIIEKSLEQLRQELEVAQTKQQQYAHQAERVRNRIRYRAKGDRKERAHCLITRGAAIESVAPTVKEMGEVDFYSLAEKIFSLPEVNAIMTQALSKNAPPKQENA